MIKFCVYLLAVKQVVALECYVCKNQEDNRDKCVETVKTCDIEEDRCLTEVRWGGTPYWAPSGEKQYYISKRCASSMNCSAERSALSKRCDRIWFNDWECVECCHGDRCNYYVTLAGHVELPNLFFMCLSTLLTIVLLR
ncbi:hypothetical protein HDE_06448 [Halotydeus destructor]|nr:hypothetical protein HDE_06448 [Halotydeus destructor]